MDSSLPPVAVLGAGPIGLACAAELRHRGHEVIVFERGDDAATSVREWSHVRMFSPWRELTSPTAVRLIGPAWREPREGFYPTGAQWLEQYLLPLAEALGDVIRHEHEVVGVSRLDRDRMVDSGRDDVPYIVHTRTRDGRIERHLARAVVDATGTWNQPNPLGSEGYPVDGERRHADRIHYGIPRVEEGSYAGEHVAVVGSGASALTTLIALTRPGHDAAAHVTWVVRRPSAETAFGGGDDDELPARGELGKRVRRAVNDGRINLVTGFRTARLVEDGGTLTLESSRGREITGVTRIVCATGFRPDFSFLSEARLNLDASLQAPARLAEDIDPTWHSCGSVTPHGYDVLEQTDKNLFIAGIKSYGGAPSFLAMTGVEQVRSIAAYLAGDLDAARRVELVLPATGVCGGAGTFDDEPAPTTSCCTTGDDDEN